MVDVVACWRIVARSLGFGELKRDFSFFDSFFGSGSRLFGDVEASLLQYV
jgi:endo-beta-N-acetylglucosaminidase D